ncbi:sugar porter family MFS transporter [Catenovulum sp. 2E275]|uniref:sugar porter family MFS transporter n=1 Tax=Catenovulum sp. 2E275 TaxID=2980497 RepID=UPI0021D0D01B|nr:sugar porter family MFS transporter [Catenovulum sp. 2E275]MCU4676707.1 sugar porter family MFS transporter [Catenovulum sp. 2E275]
MANPEITASSSLAANPATENKAFIILISCIATIGGFLFGYDSGVINGTVDGIQVAFNSDSVGTGFNVASMLLGCALGAALAGRLADLYGRKAMLILSAIFFLVSAWGTGISTTSEWFIFFRVVGGFAVGAASVMTPAYISEVAPARYRGRLATIQQVAIISGLTAAFLSNYLLADISGSALNPLWMSYETWRWMFWVELVPAGIFLLALFLIPESPRYLVARHKDESALNTLSRLYGAQEANKKLNEIQQTVSKSSDKPKLSDLYDQATQKIRPIIWIGIGLAVFQQFVGINVVFYYGAVLWQSVGFSESDALFINILSGSLSIAACLVTIVLVDKIGRKPLLWFGSIGMAVTLSITAYAFSTATVGESGQPQLSDTMGTLALIFANLYVIFFNMSWGPVMWVMLGEMFPNRIRGLGLAIAGFFQWIANFAITMTFPIMLGSVGLAGSYGFYAVCAAVSAVFVYKMVQETKGKELEQMQG